MEATSEMLTDEQVALLVQKGDKEKFGILMERYDAKLTRYGQRFLSDRTHIDDLVQDIFISTFQNIQSFNTSLKFSSWIYRIAHNTFVNALKKKSISPVYLPDIDLDILLSHSAQEDPASKMSELKEMREMIDRGLDELSPKYKEAIILNYLEDLSYKEISDVLQIPVGTVGIRVKRGKEALRNIYNKMNLQYGE